MTWNRLDDDARATLDRNEALRDSVLGPEVDLDESQERILALFFDLRRQAGPEQGIQIPSEMDPLTADYLRALDQEYSVQRQQMLKDMQAERETRAAMQKSARSNLVPARRR